MRMTRLLPLLLIWPAAAADLPGSKDPPLLQRSAGSEIIGYRSPKFDEFLLPLGPLGRARGGSGPAAAAEGPGAKEPPRRKRDAGSESSGERAPKGDEGRGPRG